MPVSPNFKVSNKGKKYKDRHADERLVVYYLRRHLTNLRRILKKVGKS